MKQSVILLVITSIAFLIINSCSDKKSPTESTDPNIIITSHSDGDTVFGFVEIHCEPSNNNVIDIIKTELWVNGYYAQYADSTQPFTFNWYTKQSPDGIYEIKIKYFDSEGNEYFSDPITLNVDNSPYRPIPVNVLSVTYDKSGMKVVWEKSNADDFLYYGILHFIGKYGPQGQIIPDIYDIKDTTLMLNNFDPTVENWFRVVVADTQGYFAYGEELVNALEQPPLVPTIKNIQYENNSFNVSWGKNVEDDFSYYILYESESLEMQHKTIAFYSDNASDTTFSVNIGADEFKFYQVEVVDYWDLSSTSEIKFTSSYPKIAFVSNKDGINDIIKMDSDGTNVINLTNSDDLESFPQPFPNDSKILFLKNTWGTNGLRDEIFMMNEDGTNQTQLTQNGISHNVLPVISLDGLKIAYSNNNGIHIIDVNSQNSNTILNDSGLENLDFSTNGEKLVYTKFGSNYLYTIRTVNIDGSNPTTIKSVRGSASYRIYFVNNDRIIYQYSNQDSSRIYIMDSDGTNLINLTPDYSHNRMINISDDETRLIIRSGISGHLETKIINLDGTLINTLNMSTESMPYFSSNNNKIVFYKSDWYNNEPHHNIYLIDADGNNLLKLTEDNTHERTPIFLHH